MIKGGDVVVLCPSCSRKITLQIQTGFNWNFIVECDCGTDYEIRVTDRGCDQKQLPFQNLKE